MNCLKIGVITYNCPHLKTQQLIDGLHNNGNEMKLFTLPFVERKTREVYFQHRPQQIQGLSISDISKKYHLEVVNFNSDSEIPSGMDYYLIGGAGILSSDCVKGKRIINCHPGLIPLMRGLDSFKWAIDENLPVGNTLHFIDRDVDKGAIIYQEATLVKSTDTLESFAARHYQAEIRLLVDFEKYLLRLSQDNNRNKLKEGPIRKRMPYERELLLPERFQVYKKQYC